jgi:4-hydroxy-tetrahydrodipicolinate reductase
MRIAVGGAAGRTGRYIVRAVVEHPDAELAAAVERADHPGIGADVAGFADVGRPTGVALTSDLATALARCDALIDFSVPQGADQRVDAATDAGVALVVGTTGLDVAARQALDRAARVVPVVASPNMSVGVNVVLALLRRAAEMLGPGYDFEIFEMHHGGKVDAPSGTALRMAEVVAEVRGLDLGAAARHGRSGALGPRRREEIGIHAARGGDVVGDHLAIFAGPGERLELVHRAHSRDTFARGAVRAALWTAGRAPGLYGMADVLAGSDE